MAAFRPPWTAQVASEKDEGGIPTAVVSDRLVLFWPGAVPGQDHIRQTLVNDRQVQV